MIDLTKPIRTKDGRAAKYLGELPDGRHAVGYQQMNGGWSARALSDGLIEMDFEQCPPAPPKLKFGYCPVWNDGEVGSRETDVKRLWQYKSGKEIEWAIDLSTLTEKNYVRVAS